MQQENTKKKSKEYTVCLRCGRKLKSEEAKKLGYGKVCLDKMKNKPKSLF